MLLVGWAIVFECIADFNTKLVKFPVYMTLITPLRSASGTFVMREGGSPRGVGIFARCQEFIRELGGEMRVD